MSYSEENIRQLKKQNLVLATILSGLIYPAMFFTIVGFGAFVIIPIEPSIHKKILLMLPNLIGHTIFIGVLLHVQKYLSNFSTSAELKSTIRWSLSILYTTSLLFPFAFFIQNRDTGTIILTILGLSYILFFFMMIALSKQIAQTKGAFVKGVEDFNLLHLTPDSFAQQLASGLTNASTIYVAVATPIYVFRMFSKALKYAEKHRFVDSHHLD